MSRARQRAVFPEGNSSLTAVAQQQQQQRQRPRFFPDSPLALLLLLLLAPAAFPHTFHKSFTELNHNTAAGTLEIILRIHADDVEAYLALKKKKPIDLGSLEDLRPLVSPFVQDVFKLYADDEAPLALKWIGAKVGLHFVDVYLEAPAPKKLTRLENTVLIDFLPDQRNFVTVTVDNRPPGESFEFNRSDTTLDSPLDSPSP